MKPAAKRWLARSVFVALVAIGTLVAGPRVAVAECGYPSAGMCPPLESTTRPIYQSSCWLACQDIGFDGGTCVVSCCRCFL